MRTAGWNCLGWCFCSHPSYIYNSSSQHSLNLANKPHLFVFLFFLPYFIFISENALTVWFLEDLRLFILGFIEHLFENQLEKSNLLDIFVIEERLQESRTGYFDKTSFENSK